MTEYARLVVAVDSTQVRRSTDDLRRMTAESRSAGGAVGSLTPIVTRLAGAFAGLKVGQFISETVLLSSRYGELGVVMEVVGRNAGYSRIQLDELEAGLKRTGISALESRNNIARMISANIDLAKATDLARLAQDAAVIGGLNSSDAFQRLITGIQTGQVETLRTIGLNVNFQRSYEQLAQQLGKTTNDLTEYEKTQARTNSVMDAAPNIAGAYEASMENAGKALRSASRHLEDFRIGLGESLQTEFAEGVELYSSSLKFLGENVDTVATLLKVGLYAAAGRAAGGVVNLTRTTIANTVASSAQAAQELRLANAHAATTAQALAHATANNNLTGATGRLTAATAAHEAALRRQAAAQAASAGVGRALLGVMGGPVGIIATVGLAALAFVDFGSKAESGMGRAANASEQAAIRIRNAMRELLPEDMGQLSLVELQAEADRLKTELVGAQSELERFQRSFDKGNIDEQWLVKPRERVAALESAIAKLSSTISGDLFETDLAGQRWLAGLQQRSDFAGEMTETQKVLISIEKGYAGTLSETDRQAALTYAGIIDRASAAARATKGAGKATDELADSYNSALSAFQRQVALYGEATETAKTLYELEHGSLKGIAGQQAERLKDLAAELDAKRDLTEQERLRIQLLRESGQLRAANDAQFELEYAAKIAEYEKQGNQEALQRLETLKRIREIQMNADQAPGTVEGVTRAPQSQGVDAMFGGATGELIKLQDQSAELEAWRQSELEKQQGFLETKAINEEVYAERVRNIHQQHQAELSSLEQARTQVSLAATEQLFGSLTSMAGTFAGEQSGIYRAMFAVQKAAAIAQSIIAIQQGIAMAAANPWPANLGAMASVAAATAGIVSNIAAVGMAHDGIDSIPKEGTWLLDKGERVVDRRTNADLKDYLAGGGGGGGRGGAPVISISAPVTVEAQPGTSQEDAQQYGREVAGAMVATTLSTIEKESRPGGLLWNLYGGGR